MARNDVDFDYVFSFFQEDGTTPLYLTTTGVTGGPKLEFQAFWAPYPIGGIVLSLYTDKAGDGTIAVLDSPNDYQIYMNVPSDKMADLPAQTYTIEFNSPDSDDPPLEGYGTYQVCVTQGLKNQ